MKHNLFLKPLNALSRKLTVASVSVGIFLKKEEEYMEVKFPCCARPITRHAESSLLYYIGRILFGGGASVKDLA